MAIPRSPGPDDQTVTLSRLVLDRPEYDALEEIAKAEERTLAQQIRFALKNWLKGRDAETAS